jgi:hypothetical protein
MSVTLWLALTLQFATVCLLRLGLGKGWLRRPVTLLVLASVVYDGLSQVLLAFPSVGVWDTYRNGVQQGFIDEANLVMSAGMLAFTIAYLLTGPARRTAPLRDGDAAAAARMLDWRILALACAPLAVLTYEGRGYNGSLTIGAGAGLQASLAAQFFVILVLLAGIAFLLRHGSRWFLPVLAAQSVLLAAAGERTPVITDAIGLAIVLCYAGARPRRGHLVTAAAVITVLVLGLTWARAGSGRALYHQDSGLGTRVVALGGGLASGSGSSAGTPPLIAQAAVRLDGTAFAGGILQGEALGQPRLPAAGVAVSLLLVVPAAAWPGKLSSAALNPARAQIGSFGLQPVNFLPGLPGLYEGFLPAPWLITLLAFAGLLAGRGERWLLRRASAPRMVLLAGAVIAAAGFEGGAPSMITDLRSAAVIALTAWLAGKLAARRAEGPSVLPVTT